MLENFVANKNYAIEYYYMKGCSHCEKFNNTGIWEELEKTYGKSIKFNKYENRENPEKVKKYDITGFPTIIIISNEKIVEEYNGNRSKDDLEKFIKRYI
jgi:thiol-disulfide isomerase/thioredoxin